MPRLPRLHVPGGFYHVMLRGNHSEDLFSSLADRDALNDIVSEATHKHGSRTHAFCWMTNHLHALIQIGEKPLGKLMQQVASRYSRYRHRQLKTTGHFFERRYRAKLVELDAYLFALLRYIHRNPVTAGIVTDPVEYAWSSHRAYLGMESPSWLTTDVCLGLFGRTQAEAQQSYRQWMAQESYASEQRLLDDAHPDDPRVLGTDKFLASLPAPTIVPRGVLTLNELAEQICERHGVDIDQLRSPARQRKLSAVRLALVREAQRGRIASTHQVARYLNRSPSSISELLTRHT